MKKDTKRKIVFWSAIAVFICAISVIGVEFFRSIKAESNFNDLRELINEETPEISSQNSTENTTEDIISQNETSTFSDVEIVTTPSDVIEPSEEVETTVEEKVILKKYEELYEINNNLVGWIKIAGTVIDYPVLEIEGDNDYYLTHDFYNEKSRHGQIIFDYRCDFEMPSTNMLLHGHHMADGSMFGGLRRYKKQSYYEKHKYIEFDTIYEEGTYEIFAVFLSKVYNKGDKVFKYYNFIDAGTEGEFDTFVANVMKLSLYDTGVIPTYGDTFLTLSTCEYSQDNGRLVVIARKLSEEELAEIDK